MKDFRDLKVWDGAHQLTLRIYRVTSRFPAKERYGLISQIRRAAASIPANIAEGCGREGDAEFARFLQISMGSASELEYHLLLARDLGFLDLDEHANLEGDLIRMKKQLNALLQTLRKGRAVGRSTKVEG